MTESGKKAPIERLALSISEAAEALGLGDDMVRGMADRGEIVSFYQGRRRLISIKAIHAWIAAKEEEASTVTLGTRPYTKRVK